MNPQDSHIHRGAVSVVMRRHIRLAGWSRRTGARGRAQHQRRTHGAPPGGDGDRAARRRRAARGADGPAHAQGALHGRRVGVPGRRRGRRAKATAAAAVREVEEEAGLTLPDPAALVPFARWITPPEVTMRFDTWFFLARAPEGQEAEPDGQEIVDARWFAPARALEGGEAGDLMLVFPTIKNLERLARFETRRRAAGVGGPARGQAGRAARRGPGRGGADRAGRRRRCLTR